MKVMIAGLDPALSNFGMAKGILDLKTGEFELKELGLQQTEKTTVKTVRTNCDDINRSRQIYDAMNDFLSDVRIVFAETPVGSQNASGMKAYGVSVALLATLVTPPIQVTAGQVKAVTGKRNATKNQVIEWAAKQYPDAKWLPARLTKTSDPESFPKHPNGDLLHKVNEHMADAIAAIHAGVESDEFIKLIQLSEK
jgi:Holliday junction resolvasome RuvABC endonuclease subunit